LAQRSDADNLSTLFDHNVTRGALKNLVTDKPSPITVALSQKESVAKNLVQMEKKAKKDDDIDHILNDHNVTKGALKNLITDKPAPITKPLSGLAQQPAPANNATTAAQRPEETKANASTQALSQPAPASNSTQALPQPAPATNATDATARSLAQGVPVSVNPTLIANEMHNASLDLNMTVGHDKIILNKQSLAQGVPVLVNPVLMKNEMATATFGEKMLVGADEVMFNKKKAPAKTSLIGLENPVENPPMNNWSVNQPSPPHAHGLSGKADLGQNIIVDGHHVHYVQLSSRLNQKTASGLN
jgi:hypothetical protein